MDKKCLNISNKITRHQRSLLDPNHVKKEQNGVSQASQGRPQSYLDMLVLEENAQLVLTDSGGMQKEAYFFHVPCVTLRYETEWVELLDLRVNVLDGAKKEDIVREAGRMLDIELDFARGLYGDGKAKDLIVRQIVE